MSVLFTYIIGLLISPIPGPIHWLLCISPSRIRICGFLLCKLPPPLTPHDLQGTASPTGSGSGDSRLYAPSQCEAQKTRT